MQETSTHSREEIAIEVQHVENESYESVYHIKYSVGFKLSWNWEEDWRGHKLGYIIWYLLGKLRLS